jgi:hypothetical protein
MRVLALVVNVAAVAYLIYRLRSSRAEASSFRLGLEPRGRPR